MTSIKFFAAGIPKAQPRPRAFAKKVGTKWMARVYDAGTAEGWKSIIAIAAGKHKPKRPIATACQLTLYFYMPRPKSHTGKSGLKATAPERPTGKPDCDNLAKAAMDVLTQLGFWTDDSLVTNLDVHKLYANGDDRPPGLYCVIMEYETHNEQLHLPVRRQGTQQVRQALPGRVLRQAPAGKDCREEPRKGSAYEPNP